MAIGNNVTIVGNVTREPELKFTASGTAVANFGVAWNDRRFNKQTNEYDETVSFFDVTVWSDMAENVAETLTKGMRVVVAGRLDQRSWETAEGEKRNKVEIVADEVSPSTRWATAVVTKTDRRDQASTRPVPNEPPAGYNPDEEPF